MPSGPHLLLVEDERSIRAPLKTFLEKNGYRVSEAETAAEARKTLEGAAIDLMLADIMMPGEDGLSLARFVRAQGSLPIILLTAMSEDTDKIVGLEIGADDYVTKPFNPRELLARIKTVLRRSEMRAEAATQSGQRLRFAGFTLDLDSMRLSETGGGDVPLSTGEFALLRVFADRPGRVLTRDQLLDLTQGRDANPFDRAIDNAISRLRKKIEPDPRSPTLIKTVHGAGYMFTPRPETT